MNAKIITGNEAVALGALRAGIVSASGYPGTPSSGALDSLLEMQFDDRHVEWSVNEKVALEIAIGASWAGQRALCTMKMSGLNVAYDALISLAYSGCVGGLVVYVGDDPGANAGMCEQDSRGFAIMSDLPILEPRSVAETYELMPKAYELSEATGSPVFVRLVTSLANSSSVVQVEDAAPAQKRETVLERDIGKYTKAGAALCTTQHRDLIARLEKAGHFVRKMGLNQLQLTEKVGGLGIIASGVIAAYLGEAFEIAERFGLQREQVSVLQVVATNPFPDVEVQAMLQRCGQILVLEELEPYLEMRVYVQARQLGFVGQIIGKLDGCFSRIGEYGVAEVLRGIDMALGLSIPSDLVEGRREAEALAAARPITCCPGCPHRGTYLAINRAIRKLGLKQKDVMVTGDIGCTILGMNPPFHTVWNEVSMGTSVSLAQGYVHGGVHTPIIATIGDSTFFHGGIPGLVNAVQHQVPMTLIIMDNGWTAMTGMQVNPGTAGSCQLTGDRRIDIAKLVPALGVEHFFVMDPFDLDSSTATVYEALTLSGVKVILARQECAIQAMRRGQRAGQVRVVPQNCNLCKLCITVTGCPAIAIDGDVIEIDPALCYGCGLCAEVCNREAIEAERLTQPGEAWVGEQMP